MQVFPEWTFFSQSDFDFSQNVLFFSQMKIEFSQFRVFFPSSVFSFPSFQFFFHRKFRHFHSGKNQVQFSLFSGKNFPTTPILNQFSKFSTRPEADQTPICCRPEPYPSKFCFAGFSLDSIFLNYASLYFQNPTLPPTLQNRISTRHSTLHFCQKNSL